MAAHLRDRGIVREPDRHISVLMEAAPREAVEVVPDGEPVTAIRIRAEGGEAIEMPYARGSIVFCGHEGMSDGMQFGLDRTPGETPGRPPQTTTPLRTTPHPSPPSGRGPRGQRGYPAG